ncbi:type VI secretion system baseplate subunit TssE [Martelella alba]|nr:type VI secretion system baseplate subunit TssE [Martelella alba]
MTTSAKPPAGAPYRRTRLIPPLLLERLAGIPPGPDQPVGDDRRIMRDSVRAHLQLLLNCARPHYPDTWATEGHLASNVLRFGLPPLAGKRVSELGPPEIAAAIKTAILRFEPRIAADGLHIDPLSSESLSPYLLSFVIQGRLRGSPEPADFTFYSQVDLESGHVGLTEQG